MSHDPAAPGLDVDALLRAAERCSRLVGLRLVEVLGGSDRSAVARVADAAGTTYVGKVTGLAGPDSFERERAGLRAVRGRGVSADLLGDDAEHRLLVMTDIGTAAPVSDLLMATDGDPGAAEAGLVAWARAVGAVHALDGAADAFAADLALDAPAEPAHRMPGLLAETATRWREDGPRLGLPASLLDAVDALPDLTERFARAARVLSPGDACPDNNVLDLTHDRPRAVLLDWERAEARHPAWDAAYLTTPWPTCWCSWALPERVADAALTAYAEAAGTPRDPAFEHDLALATLGWAFLGSGWLLVEGLDDAPSPYPGEMPSAGQRAVGRLRSAARLGARADAGLAALAAAAADAIAHRTGAHLPLMPVFARGGR